MIKKNYTRFAHAQNCTCTHLQLHKFHTLVLMYSMLSQTLLYLLANNPSCSKHDGMWWPLRPEEQTTCWVQSVWSLG